MEVLVVLAIALVLAGAASGWAVRGEPGLERKAAALARELRLARGEALASGRDRVILLDVERGAVIRDGEVVLDLGSARMGLETAASVAQAHGTPGIVFFGGGGSTGGRIGLVAGGEERALEVRWLTGAVLTGADLPGTAPMGAAPTGAVPTGPDVGGTAPDGIVLREAVRDG
jgi:general secretion pathway protein H